MLVRVAAWNAGGVLLAGTFNFSMLMQAHTRNAAKTHAISDMRSIADALEMYKLDIGHYPRQKDGLRVLVKNVEHSRNWAKPYITRLPKDPWGHAYGYRCPGPKGKDFQISAVAKDGEVIAVD